MNSHLNYQLFNIVACLAMAHIVLLILFTNMSEIRIVRLDRVARKLDGHWIGLVLMIYAMCSAAFSFSMLVWFWNWDAFYPIRSHVVSHGAVRGMFMLGILCSGIPYYIGREIYRGHKLDV